MSIIKSIYLPEDKQRKAQASLYVFDDGTVHLQLGGAGTAFTAVMNIDDALPKWIEAMSTALRLSTKAKDIKAAYAEVIK